MSHEFPGSLWDAVLDQATFTYGSARLHHCGPDWKIAARVIPDEMLHVLRAGRIRWRLGSTNFEAGPGDLVFIPPAVPWWADRVSEELLELIVVHFEARFPGGQRYLAAVNVPHLVTPSDNAFTPVLDELLAADANNSPGITLRRRALLLELVWKLVPYQQAESSSVAPATADDPDADRVWQVIRFFHENLGEPLTRAGLARQFHLAESTLAALFRRHTGQSPMQYLARLRLEAAQRLLRTTSLSITEVAREVGYEDAEYFGRVFRQQTGVTPREYRRETTDGRRKP